MFTKTAQAGLTFQIHRKVVDHVPGHGREIIDLPQTCYQVDVEPAAAPSSSSAAVTGVVLIETWQVFLSAPAHKAFPIPEAKDPVPGSSGSVVAL